MTEAELEEVGEQMNHALYTGFVMGAKATRDVALSTVRYAETRMEDAIVDAINESVAQMIGQVHDDPGFAADEGTD